jgi:hypothetical protein
VFGISGKNSVKVETSNYNYNYETKWSSRRIFLQLAKVNITNLQTFQWIGPSFFLTRKSFDGGLSFLIGHFLFSIPLHFWQLNKVLFLPFRQQLWLQWFENLVGYFEAKRATKCTYVCMYVWMYVCRNCIYNIA